MSNGKPSGPSPPGTFYEYLQEKEEITEQLYPGQLKNISTEELKMMFKRALAANRERDARTIGLELKSRGVEPLG